MKTLFILLMSLFTVSGFVNAQISAAVFVTFKDNKAYTARQLAKSATDISVEFVHSRSLYKFNNQGLILSSNGAYPVGTKVASIGFRDYVKTITNEPDMELYKRHFVGIRFSDNQIYFGAVDLATTNDIVVTFSHSLSEYGFSREKGSWVIHRIKGGTYQENDKILDIYLLGELYSFYN